MRRTHLKLKGMKKLISLLVLMSVVVGCGPSHNNKPNTVVTDEGKFVVVDDQWIDADLFEESQFGIMGQKPSKVKTWPGGVLPLVFDKNVPQNVRSHVWNACARWASVANITCHDGEYQGRKLTVSRSYFGADSC